MKRNIFREENVSFDTNIAIALIGCYKLPELFQRLITSTKENLQSNRNEILQSNHKRNLQSSHKLNPENADSKCYAVANWFASGD